MDLNFMNFKKSKTSESNRQDRLACNRQDKLKKK